MGVRPVLIKSWMTIMTTVVSRLKPCWLGIPIFRKTSLYDWNIFGIIWEVPWFFRNLSLIVWLHLNDICGIYTLVSLVGSCYCSSNEIMTTASDSLHFMAWTLPVKVMVQWDLLEIIMMGICKDIATNLPFTHQFYSTSHNFCSPMYVTM